MIVVAHILVIVAVLSYLIGAGSAAIVLARGQSRWGFVLIKGSGAVSVLALLVLSCMAMAGSSAGIETAALYYSLFLLVVEGGSWLANLRSVRDRMWLSTGGLAALVTMSALSHVSRQPLSPIIGGAPLVVFGLHVISAVIAEGCLALIAIVAVASVAADKRLRRMQLPLPGVEEPSLVRLDGLYCWLLIIGFAAISVSAASGGVWALISHAPIEGDATLYFALISWVSLGLLLHLRCGLGLSLLRVAPIVSIGIPVLFIGYILLVILRGEIFHQKFLMKENAGSVSIKNEERTGR